jgi:hypothetical protein
MSLLFHLDVKLDPGIISTIDVVNVNPYAVCDDSIASCKSEVNVKIRNSALKYPTDLHPFENLSGTCKVLPSGLLRSVIRRQPDASE